MKHPAEFPIGPLPASAEEVMSAQIEVTCYISAVELEAEILRLRNLESALGRSATLAEIVGEEN